MTWAVPDTTQVFRGSCGDPCNVTLLVAKHVGPHASTNPCIYATRLGQAGTSLMVQWLRVCALNAGVPGQGARAHMPQLNILHAATKTQCSQINKLKIFLLKKFLKRKSKIFNLKIKEKI